MRPRADDDSLRIFVLSGAGGGVPDLRAFAATPADFARFAPVRYPGWRRYVDEEFSLEVLIRDLANEIVARNPIGRVGILGVSLGGHLGYAVALRLQSLGIEVAGLCVVDSFIISSDAVRPGSSGRYFARALALTRGGSLASLFVMVRSLFWRALLRLVGGRAISWLRRWRQNDLFRAALRIDPLLEKEISMRLLLRAAAPWISGLDRNPIPLLAPAAHMRTGRTSEDDMAWRARCPNIMTVEIAGDHEGLLDPENFVQLRRGFASATLGWR